MKTLSRAEALAVVRARHPRALAIPAPAPPGADIGGCTLVWLDYLDQSGTAIVVWCQPSEAWGHVALFLADKDRRDEGANIP
jgi:hypothetical protein